jgi:hypothetical protein
MKSTRRRSAVRRKSTRRTSKSASSKRKPSPRVSRPGHRATRGARRASKPSRRNAKLKQPKPKQAKSQQAIRKQAKPKPKRRAQKSVSSPTAARQRPQSRRATPPKSAASRPTQPSEAERRLLTLASDVATLAKGEQPVAAVLRRLAAAYAPEAPLPRAVARAWLAARGDKTMTLALAWARENVRLALEEALVRVPHQGTLPGPADVRASLLLAACEALAQEPAAAVADRFRTLLELTGQETDPL